MSTMESEYVGASIACIAVTLYRFIDDEIANLGARGYNWAKEKHLSPSVVMTDNQATMINANNPRPSPKSRHIERRFRYVTIGTERKRHILLFIKSELQLADIGTKSTS
jgi:hypothetical protein